MTFLGPRSMLPAEKPIPHTPAAPSAPPLARFDAPALAFSFGCAAFLLFQIGYAFETGDQLQYLLLPYRLIDPGFVPGDWFTWHTSHYHLAYAALLVGLQALVGQAALPYAVFIVHLLTLVLLCYGLLRLSRALGFGMLEAAFAVLVVGFVREAGMAGAVVSHGRLVPADMALPPFLLACAACVEGRSLRAGLWLGLSGLFHANYAVLGPLVLAPLEAERALRARRVGGAVRMALGYAAIASPSLALIVGSFVSGDAAPEAVAITLFYRSPHHYDLAQLPASDFYHPLMVGAAVLPSLFSRRSFLRGARLQLLLALFSVLCIALVGSGLRIVPLARLFAFRMSVPLLLLLLLLSGHALRALLRDRPRFGAIWALGWLASVVVFARGDLLEVAPFGSSPLFALPVLALLGVSAHALASEHGFGRFVVVGCTVAAVAWSGFVMSAPRVPVLRGGMRPEEPRTLHLFDAPLAFQPPARDLPAMVRARTPSDARFLIPPSLIDFRLHARRAVFVDWKCAPMKGDEALEWKRRMLAAMGVDELPDRGYELRRHAEQLYAARPLGELVELARREGLTHVVVPRKKKPDAVRGARRLFNAGPYAVYELEEPR